MRGLSGGSILVLVVLVAPVWCQSPHAWPLRPQFFDCAVVQFFGQACTPAIDVTRATATHSAPEAVTSGPTPPTEPAPPQSNPAPADITLADTAMPSEPLFTPETVSPDTPPLLLRLLQEPTEANARAFLAWYQARLDRIQQVQTLLDALGTTAAKAPVSLETSEPRSPGQGLHPPLSSLLPPPALPHTAVTPVH